MNITARIDKNLQILGIKAEEVPGVYQESLGLMGIKQRQKGEYLCFDFVKAIVGENSSAVIEIKLKDGERLDVFRKEYEIHLVLDVTPYEETLRHTFEKIMRGQQELGVTLQDSMESMRETQSGYARELDGIGENSFEARLVEMKDAKNTILKFRIDFEDLSKIIELNENGFLKRMAIILSQRT